jgi:beta-lactamase class A
MKKIHPRHITFVKYWSGIVFVILGFVAGLLYSSDLSDYIVRNIPSKNSISNAKLAYIDPELDTQKKPVKYVPFELRTSKRIFEEINLEKSVSLSVYVRNLDNGPWFGIREKDSFAPIRSLKTPIFIAYLKWSEEEKSLLDKKLTIKKISDNETDRIFIPRNRLKIEQSYSVRELLEEMMVNSSMTATETLFKNIPHSLLTKVDIDLWVFIPGEEDIDDSISLKEYSSFFRILYNASYLSPASSQFALSLLTKTDFPDGIRKWVPPTYEIANKFGERIYTNSEGVNEYQLHDCGIVYYTPYPYLVCISAKSKNTDKLRYALWETSRIIFEEISAAYPQN